MFLYRVQSRFRNVVEGPYPHRLKKRVASDYGHLNNQQAGELLAKLVGPDYNS